MLEDLDLSAIADERVRQGMILLLNLVEELKRENAELRVENQRLRDEINRLKGEQGQPQIKANTPKSPPSPPSAPTNYSSEKRRQTPKEWKKTSKTDQIRIDREQTLAVDKQALPEDAQFKGHADVVVQDVVFATDNVLFHKEKFYSPSQGKSYQAELPTGYDGQFGPGIKALSIVLYHGANVSEAKLGELYGNVGIVISAGQISNLLIKDQEQFHAEKAAVTAAGLASTPWQQIDDTSTRVGGQNQYCQIVCNPFYTSYQTTESKDRQTVLDVLRNGRPRQYLLNTEAASLLETVLSQVAYRRLSGLPRDQVLDEATLERLEAEHLGELGTQQRKWVRDALAVAAYHAEEPAAVVQLLLADGAPQFTWLTRELALCWIHEARHYNRLLPCYPPFQKLLDGFLERFWKYYRQLLAYREQPTVEERERLSTEFDEVFSLEPKTGYHDLDERIAKTRGKKAALLQVLEHPEIPLHNNESELGARQRVRKRDVSFGPQVRDGARAWDTFQTLAATATKLGVSFYAYVVDRISQANCLLGLDRLIAIRAMELNLAASWASPVA